MQLKVIIFSILLNGSYVDKLLYFDESELISIEKYKIDTDTVFTKILYRHINSDQIKELKENVVTNIPLSKFNNDSWTMENFDSQIHNVEVTKIDDNKVSIVREIGNLTETTISEKKDTNSGINILINESFKYENNSYLILNSETYSNGVKFFSLELKEFRDANKEEIDSFKKYRKLIMTK